MARGNQRDKAREKALKAAAGVKPKNTQSGTQFARTKEEQAAIMRAKQAAAEAKRAADAAKK
ncbi:hypothetical protein IAQ61_000084 [Plenodomus lingam]|uniref:Small EDRK-rich factor-like N-terminal domain-containing protein n=1 Tax=Leptosphaeria maculans (strain JN3 / isolate v23.1.3 / race Av1-4-5-6-7-8) TaxID=985895 RepID=E5R498_LEPMJ|nr:hypothetical protein LEMA_P045720.1 [Plenodomus lingam JN3]KAH9881360.1 hypothetical protein IAQ61_000084 [Plenodomus lingam]CBX91866.1 hypothetical protein LEMA_P045720.1 [Plenodomus lingam JN3]